MADFAIGLAIGLAVALFVGFFAARAMFWRIVRLQQRAKHAERLAELGTLTSGLAHEIKNPLSTLQLNLQLLAEDILPQHPSYTRLINRLNTAQRETARLCGILDDFLRYAGKIDLQRQPVDVGRMLDELVDFYSPQAQVNRVQLRLRPPQQAIVAEIDERLIKQAVLNLMLNALQAMPQGGEMILAAASCDKEVRIDVIDTGTGIPEDSLEKIFEAYHSTKKGGTGLGLATTRRIVEEHGGRVTVTSQIGKGSDFVLHLPLKSA